ncbi:hypothetical protein Patl1_01090 [Pistacia atlantica]|uniref:Uncharacterized protein n=1 Tax=Pistacia atlantica TaxID=434234 RepID=A0ACC1CBK5_9ROSI|nr:hypothetical protein Patl1_01090 [Pistacia atlantica]
MLFFLTFCCNISSCYILLFVSIFGLIVVGH